MDEIEAFMDKAYHRLQVAQDLFRLGHYEDVVNRAYYAMLAAAMASLRLRNIDTKTHRGITHKLGEIFVKTGELDSKFTKRFQFAGDLRNKVDYYSFESVTDEQAEVVMEDAQKFIDAIAKLIEE